MTKTLFRNHKEHWEWAYKNYLRFKTDDCNIWGDHLEKCLPFFAFDERQRGNTKWDKEMTPAEKESFEYYKTATPQKEESTIAGKIDTPELLELLGFEYDSSKETDDMYSPIDKDYPEKTREDITYPCVLCSWMESSFDRFGDNSIICVEFVTLKDFGITDGKLPKPYTQEVDPEAYYK
jgi:hypothetical protein